jgi:DNA-binding beta-propeller fold protein YncE
VNRSTRREFVVGAVAGGAALVAGVGMLGSARADPVTRRLYVAINGSMTIYDVPSWSVVKTIPLPTADGPRGIACHPGLGSLWITHGAANGTGGSILRYDLATDTVLWDLKLGFGVDQLAVTLDGSKLYVPSGEKSTNNLWHILDPLTGNLLGTITGGLGPHNTIARSQHVYLAAGKSTYVYLDNGFTIGPLIAGCRPFTVDAAESLIYTTATKKRGFQVSSITTGKVLTTVSFGSVPRTFKPAAPSHGVSLSPDGSELWVMDMPAQRVRVYTSGTSPVHLADVVINPIKGVEQPNTAIDEIKDGWVLHSKLGDYVYIGDSGSVISTATRKQVALLPTLNNGRHGFLEVMFDSTGKPVDTSTHFGMSY